VFLELFRVGWGEVMVHKARAALTVSSIAAAAFSIVVMASLARSGAETLARGIEEVGGARMVTFFSKPPERAERKRASYARGLTLKDAEALRGRIPHVRWFDIHRGLGSREVTVTAGAGQSSSQADLMVGNQDFLGAFGMKLAAGRGIDREDLAGQKRVAVLGPGVARALFPAPAQALGRLVRAGADGYRVVGVTAPIKRFGVDFDFQWNDFVLVPASAAASGGLNLLLVTDDKRHNELAKRLAAAILGDRHHGVDDFVAFDFGIYTDKFDRLFRVMEVIVTLIAAVALVVGGIGIMNIMLVSLNERVGEVGVRKALGASNLVIAVQVLCESAMLAGIGGVAGASVGAVVARTAGRFIARRQEAWVVLISGRGVVTAIAACLLSGVLFGLLPARRASRLSVVECLRAGS
jgi:putative ABC transport system permease protein